MLFLLCHEVCDPLPSRARAYATLGSSALQHFKTNVPGGLNHWKLQNDRPFGARGRLEKPSPERHGLLLPVAHRRRLAPFKGSVAGVLEDLRPMLAKYEVYCDENWLMQRVQVERTIGSETKALRLDLEQGGLWRRSGQEIAEVRGCLDADLSVTPATNTPPIRQLNLGIGKSESVVAAWISFPELTVQPLPNATPVQQKISIPTKAIPDSRLRS
jgi:hypothetical protein